MSKIIYVCYKDNASYPALKDEIKTISDRLIPDNITPEPVKIVETDGVIYGIVNPVKGIKEQDGSVLLGEIFENEADWRELGTYPDGSYAIFRSSEDTIELVSDAAGSRSIWYYKDNERFIASTSQRAIIGLLKSFSFNKKVLPWILSTGGLGPSLSWDSRLSLLPPDSSVTLNRSSWALSIQEGPIEFSPLDISDNKHFELFKKALDNTFESLNIDFSNWKLPLSGGYDSRSILCFLKLKSKDISKLRAITWGLRKSLNQKGNDAYIAKKLAAHFKIEHKYYYTDLSDEPIEQLLNRYLICGEGRIDHVSGYLDGFSIWKTLFEDKISGIIRGDIGFSRAPAESIPTIRKRLGISLCEDFQNLKNYEEFGLTKQEFPEYLNVRAGESLAMWRDRLYHQYRMPTMLAALADLKLPYVEIINPLLSKKVIYQTRMLPDHLRNNKKLYKAIADSVSPAISHAKISATVEAKHVFADERIVNLVSKVLRSDDAKSVFSEKFINYVLENIRIKKNAVNGFTLKSFIKQHIPVWLRRKLSGAGSRGNISFNIIAFRMFTACSMYRMLHDDAESIKADSLNFTSFETETLTAEG